MGEEFEYDLNFTTVNLAPFVENVFRVGPKFSFTPGARFEYLYSATGGYKFLEGDSGDVKVTSDYSRTRYMPLLGAAAKYNLSHDISLYGNWSQCYRPVSYSELTPFGVTSIIDPNLKDSKGWNSDLGIRGTVKGLLNFDVGVFWLQYNNHIGMVPYTDPVSGILTTMRTNTDNSIHKGVESYLEVNLTRLAGIHARTFRVWVFNSLALTNAKYVKGDFKGNFVEYAPAVIERSGLNLDFGNAGISYQYCYQAKSYGDPANTILSTDAAIGQIPSFSIMDLSGHFTFKGYSFKAGINNLTNQKYFTRRTDEYPGPGIIPSIGRNFYIGFSALFE
jgi:Fe(3+) dicitrate transport protein